MTVNPDAAQRIDCKDTINAFITNVASDQRPHQLLLRSGGCAVGGDVKAAVSCSTGV